jgi:hypothetical protein
MDPKKPPVPRRVWRMTTDSPQGEFFDVGASPVEVPARRVGSARFIRRRAGSAAPARSIRRSARAAAISEGGGARAEPGRKCRVGGRRPTTC